MTLVTRDPAVRQLVERALKKGGPPEGHGIWAWNARIRLVDGTVIMEGATPLYLDHVLQSLRIFTGQEPLPGDWRSLPVRLLGAPRKRPSARRGGPR